jgi:hypothetical protein
LRGQFIILAALLFALALGQAALTTLRLRQAYEQLNTIGRDSTPSVDAAQAMGQYIEDIDAKAADYIGTAGLTDIRPCSLPGPTPDAGQLTIHACSSRVIDATRALFTNELYKAVRNVTYPGERTALDRISTGFQEYMSFIGVLRHEYDLAASKTDPNDPHLQQAHAAYLRASAVLHTGIDWPSVADPSGSTMINEAAVPPCTLGTQTLAATAWPQGSLRQNIDCFNVINKGYLDRAYENTTSAIGTSVALVTTSTLVFCGLLLFTTWRMARITHRIINIGLSAALLISIVQGSIVIGRFATLGGAQGTFKQLVRDSYDSVYATNTLKRDGTAANAAESRWLLSTQFGDQAGADRWYADWTATIPHVQSSIARAISNETFPEEHAPLGVIQGNWDAYVAIDARIRATAATAGTAEAQRVSTGASNAAFGAFIATVDQLAAVNRDYFARISQTTQERLSGDILLSIVLFPVAGLVAVWGIAQRLKDF